MVKFYILSSEVLSRWVLIFLLNLPISQSEFDGKATDLPIPKKLPIPKNFTDTDSFHFLPIPKKSTDTEKFYRYRKILPIPENSTDTEKPTESVFGRKIYRSIDSVFGRKIYRYRFGIFFYRYRYRRYIPIPITQLWFS